MKRTYIKDVIQNIGQEAKVAGWVNTVRSHGKIIFIDLRDKTGLLQVVFAPSKEGDNDTYALGQSVKSEWVVEIEGLVAERPSKMWNPKLETGKVELQAKKIKILSEAKNLPFMIDNDGYDINEEIRMKYRYLDLRRSRLQKNLFVRHNIIQFMRGFLQKEGFIEVETPIITKSTPEGARDYVVPSRLQPGKFYALPQSPQQYKQLLQVAGVEKYFQIARCFRDEDPRGDRQPEFTQLDMEMSFVEREDVMDVTERLFINLVKALFPEKQIQEIPFPRITYQDAMQKYRTDRPDIRRDKANPDLLAFCWVIDFPFFEKTEEGGWTFTHNPFSTPKPQSMKDLLGKKNIAKILTTQYDIVLNGWEIGGGSIRNHRPEALEAVFEIMGFEKKRIQENFGHMLEAFSYGAPPHGGIAPGIDRFIALMRKEPNIREVIAFPKTGDNRDLMMSAPSELTKEQLRELHLTVKEKVTKNKRKKKNAP